MLNIVLIDRNASSTSCGTTWNYKATTISNFFNCFIEAQDLGFGSDFDYLVILSPLDKMLQQDSESTLHFRNVFAREPSYF